MCARAETNSGFITPSGAGVATDAAGLWFKVLRVRNGMRIAKV